MSPASIETGRLAGDEKRTYVRDMFTAIAPRYDLLNHLLSLNIDKLWRRTAINSLDWHHSPAGTYLDVCAGTLDLASDLARREQFEGTVVGADFVVPMLALGRGKGKVDPVGADALQLPFADESFDGCTVGFGVRNLANLQSGLREMLRVLKPGRKAVILEFCTPRSQPMRGLYFLYFKRILPLVGRMVSRHDSAYSYLPNSVLSFPEPPELSELMQECGFGHVGFRTMTGGIVAVHWGVKV